jgi:hypothetical protein
LQVWQNRFETVMSLMCVEFCERRFPLFLFGHFTFELDDKYFCVKNEIVKEKNSAKKTPAMTRTVKIADGIHYKIRRLSVERRMPMQDFIELLLLYGLRNKAWKAFDEAEPDKVAAVTAA